jgi:hypothetical protein
MPSELTPEMRSLRAKIAAHMSWANTADATARTAAARQASLDRFEKQVDPDGTMDPAERSRRAESLKTAHYLKMAAASAKARRAKSRGN